MNDAATRRALAKRFFKADNHGATYWVIATDLEHAGKILAGAGIEFSDGVTDGLPFELAKIAWTEMTTEAAALVKVTDDDDAGVFTWPLTEHVLGSWFCSEY